MGIGSFPKRSFPELSSPHHIIRGYQQGDGAMTKNKNSNQQDDLYNSSVWLPYSQNPTDAHIDSFSTLEPEDSEVYSEKWQKETIKNARQDGYIKLYNLVFILAAEEKYSGLIQNLWERYHLNRKIKLLDGRVIDNEDNLIPKWYPSWINTAQGRANPWYWVLLRCTIKPYFFAEGDRLIKSQYFGYIEDENKDLRTGIDLYKFINRQPEKVNDNEEQSPLQYIKLSDLEAYMESIEEIHNLDTPLPILLFPDQSIRESSASKQPTSITNNDEDFIRNLKISYVDVSNYEIKIQEPGKKVKSFSFADLGFRDEITKGWRTFLQVLQDPKGTYCLGESHIYSHDGTKNIITRNKSYDAYRKTLVGINEKLINFFNKHYQVKIPKDFKLYELDPKKKKGTYCFKFKIEINNGTSLSKYERYTKEEAIKKFKELHIEYKTEDEKGNINIANEIMGEIADLTCFVMEKKWMTKEDITDIVKPDNPQEDIRYNPQEN